MNIKKLLFPIVLIGTWNISYAEKVTQSPLEKVLSMYSSKENIDTYYSIPNIEWGNKVNRTPNRFFSLGKLNLEVMGQSEISVSGNGNQVNDIELSNNRPSKKFKIILEKNLKSYQIFELPKCHQGENSQFFYVVGKNKVPIYVMAIANFTEEPYMSPLYTQFEFSLQKPSECK
ncbi:hypothetical protein LNQ82_00010 [Conchiformibius steedae DSM 2580]|uniref:Uncharacterized protein n=1 Tax=Conchiformibius steedae DSM 2580 TaxID=1121352 RepID=A0AAE9L007_9NEIS|nr:hypothetical protein [Conchiformibius steedae]QMT32962.1 hypothetical protein H3L98_07560 [Conchiformibius steedae]URD67584.1 hypothetical protein LNQ82_00010 [Conchiformibius steedae DSM 2580]